MSGKEFVDTNILIYAFDLTAGHKRDKAIALIERLWIERAGGEAECLLGRQKLRLETGQPRAGAENGRDDERRRKRDCCDTDVSAAAFPRESSRGRRHSHR